MESSWKAKNKRDVLPEYKMAFLAQAKRLFAEGEMLIHHKTDCCNNRIGLYHRGGKWLYRVMCECLDGADIQKSNDEAFDLLYSDMDVALRVNKEMYGS